MLATKIRTIGRLGLVNMGRVAAYRIGLMTGLHPAQWLKSRTPRLPFFGSGDGQGSRAVVAPKLFGHICGPALTPPVPWTSNPLTAAAPEAGLPWWRIPDFDPQIGDIKLIWELSRWGWIIDLAEANDRASIDALLADWMSANPPFQGPNWKCAQEASLRVLHLIAGAEILDQVSLESGLLELIELHGERILPTRAYATAQDNNHGTSEACALFVIGLVLERQGRKAAAKYLRAGRRMLEERVRRLVLRDGTFSQYSTNYHRLMLDTVSMAEAMRRKYNAPPFGPAFLANMAAASRWLADLTDPETGDVPNLGANDGAHVLNFGRIGYRDFRPSAGLGLALFSPNDQRFRKNARTALSVYGLSTEPAADSTPTALDAWVKNLADGGLLLAGAGQARALLRYPRFRFRPAQADLNHLDLWVGSHNLLRDGGSYSYNSGEEWVDYFGGIASHNSIQFDGAEPMPRLGRFLLGDWREAESAGSAVEAETAKIFTAYRTSRGARHARHVSLSANRMVVRDEVTGFSDEALLRWRLIPSEWRRSDVGSFASALMQVSLHDEQGMPIEADLATGVESRHYLQLSEVPVVEAKLRRPGTIISTFAWG